jgi:sterol desaturase/sphingolipid hydroxylase (fatty acid hydroxylase superfamily)
LIDAMLAHLPPFAVNVIRLCIWLALLSVILLPIERWIALRKARVTGRALAVDLGLYFFNSLIPAMILSMVFGLVGVATRSVLPPAFQAAMAALPFAVKLPLSFVVAEIGFYWGHRLSHRLFGMTPLFVLGLAGGDAGGGTISAAVVVLGTAWGFFIHANVRVRLGMLEWLVATPGFHHWHHTSEEPLDRNFAAMLPVLDRVFGTHYLPPQWPVAYGLAEPVAESSLLPVEHH